MTSSNYYQVNPADTASADAARYPRNFVNYPAMLAPVKWFDRLSRAVRGKPAPFLGDSLAKTFDEVGPLHSRWGTDAELEVVRRNLRLFGRSIDENPHISAIGRFLIKTMINGHLKNRADVIAHYEANRAFIEERGRYTAPILVTGFFRTGTTLLQRLLSEDTNTRSPYTYELEKTVPPLEAGTDPLQDPRIETSAATIGTLKKLAPGFVEKFSESHLWSATEKEEVFTYAQFHNGLTVTNGAGAGREYLHSLFQPDLADALMKYERNFLTMLDAYAPARSHWTNKSPTYAPYFGKIFEHYPDARVIVTHRHPGKNIASFCRLLESWLVPFDEDGSFDKIRFGQMLYTTLQCFFEAPLSYRTAHPERESQIVDCMYRDLFADPIAMVKSIYAKFDLEYTQEFEDRMKVYLEANKQGKYGRHIYTNAEYGLDLDQIQAGLGDYYAKYGYGREPEAP